MAPKLDRVPFLAPQNREFAVRPLLTARAPRYNRVWSYPGILPLDQGEEGACVGFGWCAELAVAPIMYRVNNAYARQFYSAARNEDRVMGNQWPEGASVLAGAKVAKRAGMISEYRWAFGLDDVLDTLVQRGPVVLGLNWYEGMYATDANGVVSVSGEHVGGHCITAIGYLKDHPYAGECVVWLNSWGPTYGIGGVGYVPIAAMRRLLAESGEACIATDVLRR